MAVNERELAALEQHATIGGGEAAAALCAIGDHLANGELSRQRFALRLEIDARRQAFEFVVTCLRTAQVRHHCSKVF